MIAKVEEYAKQKGMEEDGAENLLQELRWAWARGRANRGLGWGELRQDRPGPRPGAVPPGTPCVPPPLNPPLHCRGLVARLETDPNLPLDDKIKGLRQALYKM